MNQKNYFNFVIYNWFKNLPRVGWNQPNQESELSIHCGICRGIPGI